MTHRRARPQVAGARLQEGAALVVSLILLVILTLMATSGMTTSILELRMAQGRQASLGAFQVAENAIATALECRLPASGEQVRADDCAEVATAAQESYDFVVEAAPESAGLLPEGVSLGTDISAVAFTINASAQGTRGSEAEVTQGFYVLGKKE